MTINLGNIVNVNGQTTTSGIVSGLDSSAIIEQLVEVRRIPVGLLQDDLTLNSEQVTAFGQLRTILDSFFSASDFLRNVPGFNKESSNLFDYRSASVSGNSSLSAADYLSVSATAGAALGSFDIAIQQLATAKDIESGSFSSQTASATDNTQTNYFNAGTFYLADVSATSLTAGTATGNQLATADYGTGGSVSGTVLTGTGIHSITDDDGNGDANLIGSLSPLSGSYVNNPTNELTITATINGSTYTSNVISTAAGGDSLSIAANQDITFTNATTGTSFVITTGASDYLINNDDANVTQFLADIDSALAAQTITQARELSNFDVSAIRAGSQLNGLTSANVLLTSADFNATTGNIGSFGGFTVTADSGGGDGAVSVEINGETYQATGLSNGVGGVLNLTSTTNSDNVLSIDLATAGLTLDLSGGNVATLQTELDYAFGTRGIRGIEVESGDSLTEIASKINAISGQSGVSASIAKISDNDFRLFLRANEVGVENGFDLIDDGTVTTNAALTTTAAQDSLFTVNGISATRSTNVINDVISGVTFSLLREDANFGTGSQTDFSVTVGSDTETVEAGIVNFINAYNEFRVFAEQQTRREDDGSLPEGSVLGGNTTLQTLINQLSGEINGIVNGVDDAAFDSLADIGIVLTDFAGDEETPETSNILTYNPERLQNLLATNFEDVRRIFEFDFNASSGDIGLFARTNTVSLTDFQVFVDTSQSIGEQVEIRDTNGTFLYYADLSGSKISGVAGTSIEGLELLYTGDGNSQTINISLSQGISDRIFNVVEAAVEENGLLDTAIGTLGDQEDRVEEDIERLEDQIERFRAQLVAQYTALEEAISRVNNLIELLEAQDLARFGSG